MPRNFTDKKRQAARTDGELLWVLKNGSKGMANGSLHSARRGAALRAVLRSTVTGPYDSCAIPDSFIVAFRLSFLSLSLQDSPLCRRNEPRSISPLPNPLLILLHPALRVLSDWHRGCDSYTGVVRDAGLRDPPARNVRVSAVVSIRRMNCSHSTLWRRVS